MNSVAGVILLHVLTLNVWGLPDVPFKALTPAREQRLAAICDKLHEESLSPEGWDVVFLQEAWDMDDRDAFKHCGYDYVADQDDETRLLDSGVMILSRFPLDQVSRHIFDEGGDPLRAISDGEFFARKSVLMARVEHPVLGKVWLADSHLISEYDPSDDYYFDKRKAQFAELAQYALNAAGVEPLVLGGDLNFGPGYPLWSEVAGRLPGFKESPGAESACTLCPPNTEHQTNEGKVDHLFGSPNAVPVSGGIAMDLTIQVDGHPQSVSDHFGWQTDFLVEQ